MNWREKEEMIKKGSLKKKERKKERNSFKKL